MRILYSFCVIGKCSKATYLWIYGERCEFRVVHGTQAQSRIRRKNLCVYGEDAKRHKTLEISVNNGPTWNMFRTLLSIQDGID